MSRRDRHDIGRFIASIALFVVVAIVVPIGLVAVSRSRFGSANPLAGADPPWRWFGDGAGAVLGEPIADDTLADGLIRICLCVVWLAVAVIVVTTVLEVAHGVRHRGLAMPAVRGLGPVQQLARFIAVGIIVVLPALTPAPSIASTIGRAPPTVTVDTTISTASAATPPTTPSTRQHPISQHRPRALPGGARAECSAAVRHDDLHRAIGRLRVLDRRAPRRRRHPRDRDRPRHRRGESRGDHVPRAAIHQSGVHRGGVGPAGSDRAGHAGRPPQHRSHHL